MRIFIFFDAIIMIIVQFISQPTNKQDNYNKDRYKPKYNHMNVYNKFIEVTHAEVKASLFRIDFWFQKFLSVFVSALLMSHSSNGCLKLSSPIRVIAYRHDNKTNDMHSPASISSMLIVTSSSYLLGIQGWFRRFAKAISPSIYTNKRAHSWWEMDSLVKRHLPPKINYLTIVYFFLL